MFNFTGTLSKEKMDPEKHGKSNSREPFLFSKLMISSENFWVVTDARKLSHWQCL